MLNAGLGALRRAWLRGEITSEACLNLAMDCISASEGEGACTFISVYAASALKAAKEADRLYAAGKGADLPLLGLPISVKDLFDIAGEVTTAGSVILRNDPPAQTDATVVARLRRAGAIIVGRTNMTELALSGVGINPHFGTPLNPWDRATRRIPGGSSSGAAVSVSDQMCVAAIGSDTGGSIRIPSALSGLTGFKPTQATVPLDGVHILSRALDSVGPIAWTVEDCSQLFDVLSDTTALPQALPSKLRLAVPTNYFLDGADEVVRVTFEAALAAYDDGGFAITRIALPQLDRMTEINRIGSFALIEAYRNHREHLRDRADLFDPQVLQRIRAGGRATPEAMDQLLALRATFATQVSQALAPFNAFLFPTVPIVAPPIDALVDDAEFTRVNLLMLRNSTVINLIDGCALSLPIHTPGTAPVGLTIGGLAGTDRRILAIAQQLQATRL